MHREPDDGIQPTATLDVGHRRRGLTGRPDAHREPGAFALAVPEVESPPILAHLRLALPVQRMYLDADGDVIAFD